MTPNMNKWASQEDLRSRTIGFRWYLHVEVSVKICKKGVPIYLVSFDWFHTSLLFWQRNIVGPNHLKKSPVFKCCLLLFTHAPLCITSSCCIYMALEHIFKHQCYMLNNPLPCKLKKKKGTLFASYFSKWVSIGFLFLISYLQKVIPSNLMFSKIIFRAIASKMLEFLIGKSGLAYFLRYESLPFQYIAAARFTHGQQSSQVPVAVVRGGHLSGRLYFTEHFPPPHTHAQSQSHMFFREG